jgi:protein-S-isoprenylcysteine O-methyltransferase Ste14
MLHERLPSSWIVTLQLTLAAALLLTGWPPGSAAHLPAAAALLAVGIVIGVAALAANRPGNFRIAPEPKAGARLVTGGIYRWIRHPMYSALLLVTLAAVLADPRAWRIAAWLALLAVLLLKAQREERHLLQRFPQYAAYRARSKRLLPWLW